MKLSQVGFEPTTSALLPLAVSAELLEASYLVYIFIVQEVCLLSSKLGKVDSFLSFKMED